LSGGKPKVPNKIKTICLLLGPDFSTDIIQIETADHARLSLTLSYNWHFDVTKAGNDPKEATKLFSVPDFVGDACKAIASRVSLINFAIFTFCIICTLTKYRKTPYLLPGKNCSQNNFVVI
jgi:hypothetical protein